MITYEDITQLTNEEIAESCEDAADLLEGHWIQGDWNSYVMKEEDGPVITFYCVEGALAAALGMSISGMEDHERKELLACPVYDAVLETLNHQIHQELVDAGHRTGDEPSDWYDKGELPNWNDSEERTEQQVVDLLRKTAKRVLGAAE